jgi:hypothetical protein
MATAVARPTYIATPTADGPEATGSVAFDAFVRNIPTHASFWAVIMAAATVSWFLATWYTCYATVILTRTPQSTYF